VSTGKRRILKDKIVLYCKVFLLMCIDYQGEGNKIHGLRVDGGTAIFQTVLSFGPTYTMTYVHT
jgi:hypothetical protein